MFQKRINNRLFNIVCCLRYYVRIISHKNNPEIIAELKESFMGKEIHLFVMVVISVAIGFYVKLFL